MTCPCHQHGPQHCPEGERLYQLDRDAYEAEIDARTRYDDNPSEYRRHALHAAQDAYTEARKAWLDHRTGDAGERFMERVREWESGR